MRCPRCGAENLGDSLFCTECGAGIEATCPTCGADNPSAARFCRKCGKRLADSPVPGVQSAKTDPRSYTPRHLADKILQSKSALEGERKHVARKIEARALELRGRALVVLDRREEAARSLEAALEVARGIGYPPATWRSLSLLGELARRAGDRAQADRLSSEARRLVERLARSLPETELRHELGALGQRLVSDPLGTHR